MAPPAAVLLGLLLLKKTVGYALLSRYGWHRVYRRAIEASKASGLPTEQQQQLSAALKTSLRFPPRAYEELSKHAPQLNALLTRAGDNLPVAFRVALDAIVKTFTKGSR